MEERGLMMIGEGELGEKKIQISDYQRLGKCWENVEWSVVWMLNESLN